MPSRRTASLALVTVLLLLVMGAPLPPAEAAGSSAMRLDLRLPTCFDEGISVGSVPVARSLRRCILDVRTTTAVAGGFDVALAFVWTDNGPTGVTVGFSDPVVTCPAVAGAACEGTIVEVQASPTTWAPDTQTFSIFATRLCGGAPCSPVDEIRLDSQAIFLRHSTMSIHCSPWPVPVNVPSTCAARVVDAGGAGFPSTPTTPGQVRWTQILPTQNGFRQPSTTSTYCNLIAQATPYTAECDLHVHALWWSYQLAPYQTTAFWPGDASHGPSGAFVEIDPVNRASSIAVSCATVLIGEPMPCDATVTDVEAGTPWEIRGNVTVRSSVPSSGLHPQYDHACQLPTTPDGLAATCSFTVYPFAPGVIPIEARFEADTPHVRATTATTATVLRRPTVTAVACGPGTLAVGAAGSCTVSVQDMTAYTTPSGAVTLTGAGITWSPSSCLLVPTGADQRATCDVQFSAASGAAWPSDAEVDIDATYGGDGLHTASDASTLVKVRRRATSTTITCTPHVLIPIEGPTLAATCEAVLADLDAGTSPAFAGGSMDWSSGEACTGPPALCGISWVPTTVGAHHRWANYTGDVDHRPSGGTGSVRVHAETRVAYTGALSVVAGATLETRAIAASAIATCAASRAAGVAYVLDRDPFTGFAFPVPIAQADLDAAGSAVRSLSTSGWLPGTYALSTVLVGTAACDESVDTAFLVVGSAGQVASGAGSTDAYSGSPSGAQVNAGSASPQQLTFSAQKRGGGGYNGTLVLSSETWRVRGTVTSLSKTTVGGFVQCSADGLAELQVAVTDASGRTMWVSATRGTAVPFSLYLEDRGSGGTDAYALHLGRIALPSDGAGPTSGAVAHVLHAGDVGCR